MAWTIEFDPKADKELKRLSPETAKRILQFLHTRIAVTENPRSFGDALSGGELGNYWKYRVGDYRVVCEIKDRIVTVMVLRIGHRSIVYRQ